MDELHWEQPAMLFRLEILQMTVAGLSSELLQTAIQTSELSFRQHESGVVVSNEVDVVVSLTPEGTRAPLRCVTRGVESQKQGVRWRNGTNPAQSRVSPRRNGHPAVSPPQITSHDVRLKLANLATAY